MVKTTNYFIATMPNRIFKIHLLLVLITIPLSCQSQDSQVDNTKPMYGEVKKSIEHKKIDNDFIQECLTQFGTIDSSVIVITDNAWRYYYNNDLKTAMKRFNQVWLLNPNYPDSYFGFASLSETLGDFSGAERLYKIGFEKDTNWNRAETIFQKIADCKEQLNDIEGVINAYTSIINLNPNNAFAFKKIGYFHMQSNNFSESIKAYNKAIELDPKDEMTFNNRGYLYQTNKKFEKAINDYTIAIEINPKYISALVNRGISEMEINQFQKAKSDFEKCVLLDKNAGELRRILALSELKLNEISSACDNLRLALKLGDESSKALIEENCTN